jgi:iron complex outermembrane recepter protein
LKYTKAWGTKTDTGTGVKYLAFVADNKNLGKEYYTGLDIDALGRSKLDFGELTSQVTLTYMIREAKQLLADGPYYSAIGNHAELGTVTFRWQGRWTNTVKAGDWAHTFGVNFKSGYTDAATDVEVLDAGGNVIGTEAGYRLEVPRYFTLDWQTQWTPRKLLSFTVGILNVMNTNPPLSISGGGLNRGQQFGYDDRYYDSRGRTLYGNVSFKF